MVVCESGSPERDPNLPKQLPQLAPQLPDFNNQSQRYLEAFLNFADSSRRLDATIAATTQSFGDPVTPAGHFINRVVDLPEPVGPVTRTRPRGFSAILAMIGGRFSCSNVLIWKGI